MINLAGRTPSVFDVDPPSGQVRRVKSDNLLLSPAASIAGNERLPSQRMYAGVLILNGRSWRLIIQCSDIYDRMHRPNMNRQRSGNSRSKNWRDRNKNNDLSQNSDDIPQGFRRTQNNRQGHQGGQHRGRGFHRQLISQDLSSTRYFNFNRLNKLSQMKNDDVVTKLAEKKTEFQELLNNIDTPDLLVVTLQVLTNVCQANFTEIVTSVLSQACSVSFLESLQIYLSKLPFESSTEKIKNKLYWDDNDKFWRNLIKFIKKVTELLPTKARDELTSVLQKINLIIPAIEGSKGYKIDDNVKEDATTLLKELEDEIRKVEKQAKDLEILSTKPDSEEEPPENFRTLSVIPTVSDLYNEKPFIRPCKVKDAYDSVEHYLDVQFRLLREDFISPLHDGIKEYLHIQNNYRNNDLRIYKRVSFIAPEVTENHIGIKISFGVLRNIKWKTSKRFMFGSLLLLSRDNFNTILFFTVANRDIKELEQGLILVQPCEGTQISRNVYSTPFVMLESKIYFEPYLAVLNAMRRLNELNFPMSNYLVYANTDQLMPQYLRNQEHLRYKNFQLPIGLEEPWPTATDLNLDESQYAAFRCALTEEFAVIQGPPGTGKTFIALEIVRTLLENSSFWKGYGPIVVVCLTNHALDQFLEGILQYTHSIVRVGNRSKNETLAKYALMNKRKSMRYRDRNGAWPLFFSTKLELELIMQKIGTIHKNVSCLTAPAAIVPLHVLRKFCKCDEEWKFQSNGDLVNWLVGTDIGLKPDDLLQPKPAEEDVGIKDLENDENTHMDDEIELSHDLQPEDSITMPIFPLRCVDASINGIQRQMYVYQQSEGDMCQMPFTPTLQWQEDLDLLYKQRHFLEIALAQHPILNKNPQKINNPRWRIYWKWVRMSYYKAMRVLLKLEEHSREIQAKLKEVRQLVDLAILRDHKIIGLTTNGAANLHSSLRALTAPIVLVEEAAEILEAHVVCSMTQYCQHVILIGDHKQLRPKASVYKLGTKYNLNVSLFERIVNIRGDCVQLAYQHRMRPQIAKLISPSIYDTLYNHESVLNYSNVKGLDKNLFFLNHKNAEISHNSEESWVNEHETNFLVAFARHLILQGYDGSEITILCTYTGQLFSLMQATKRYSILNPVRVTTVDNYQGEENKIILLSLVRNNGEGKIGFLKEENRVCVALSRAREGLYIMGNMEDLVIKNTIWPKIKEVLESENAIGEYLTLHCQIHQGQSVQMWTANDFQQCPEGGCLKKCGADLLCGHSCTSVCHVLDREHEKYECKQPCMKSCPCDHPCQQKCFEVCGPCCVTVERQLKCGHTVKMQCHEDAEKFKCYVKVTAVLPSCEHEIEKNCYLPVEDSVCSHPCEIRLPCGHSCCLNCHVNNDPDHIKYTCYKDCTKNNRDCENHHPCKKRCHEECNPCSIIVEKSRSCGHFYRKVKCAVNIEAILCKRACKKEMNCGHNCRRQCWETCAGCPVEVSKMSPCGHTIKVKCHEQASISKCNGKCLRKLDCGHPCQAKCKDPCTKKCKTMVELTEPGLCGHTIFVPCYLSKTDPKSSEILKYCDEPCRSKLACEHLCSGKCGLCKQGRIHIPCRERCGNILVCGHECQIPCRVQCQPCTKICEARCRHSKCNKKCGIPCKPCKEKCFWNCKHRKCNKFCYELCEIEPCNEPCEKRLKCKHPCIGFCGEPCPPLCRICDKEALIEEFFLGEEDEPDARFVFLEDCSHCIESNGLITWLSQVSLGSGNDKAIQVKTCPRCKTPIKKCMRIMNMIKKDLEDVQRVKRKVFGDKTLLLQQQEHYFKTIQKMIIGGREAGILQEFPQLHILLNILSEKTAPLHKQKKHILSAQELEALKIILDLLLRIWQTIDSVKSRSVYEYEFFENQVAMLIEAIPTTGKISPQESNDIEAEFIRLKYLADVCNMDEYCDKDGKEYKDLIAKLLSIERFTNERGLEVMEGLKITVRNSRQKITEHEKKMIVRVMGFEQGHWFKCPNGHVYAVADCGGPTIESRCNECGATIGGTSHRLRSNNSLAGEMDGAVRPAYPGTI
ncbi:NFX1-type zinc finger-containing protein 1-like isoform X3 [Athalia rosae]|uniref:NFX1-type zinc finger-containing protein 1-like isoform X3 n=2 Tax=Athalia rosae TaxID=37344 RepID=UPI0020333B5A|nr:NFX1-type zinc finger-containing protein 1-like isoform X3 [Athalia rosae]